MSRPVRLLQLVHGYPPAVGGVENAVRDICEGLAGRGFEVTVLTTDAYNNAGLRDRAAPRIEERETVLNGVRIVRFAGDVPLPGLLRRAQSAAWRLRLPGNDRLRTWFHGPISPGMRRFAESFECDVVAAASFPLNHLHYAFRRRRPRPVVLLGAIHPEDAWGYERPSLIALARRAYATVALSEPEAAWFRAHGVAADRLRVIPVGIDPRPVTGVPGRFRQAHGIAAADLLVAYVGQQAEHKGVGDLVQVMPALVERVPALRLVIAGSVTPYSRSLRRLVERLPAAARSRVLVIDGIGEAEKASLLAGCDIFATPSRYESFGITTLEAWANGAAVLAGDTPAVRWVAGQAAMLVAPGDPGRLLESLVALARDPALRARLGEAGRARMLERFTVERVVDGYAALYEEAARAPRASLLESP